MTQSQEEEIIADVLSKGIVAEDAKKMAAEIYERLWEITSPERLKEWMGEPRRRAYLHHRSVERNKRKLANRKARRQRKAMGPY